MYIYSKPPALHTKQKVFDITATKMETDSLIFLPDNVLYHSAKNKNSLIPIH